MNHLNQSQLLLYSQKRGLSSETFRQIANHLQVCDECRHKFHQLTKKIEKLVHESSPECDNFYHQFIPYIHNELDNENKKRLKKHLLECEKCQELIDWLSEIPEYDSALLAEIKIPLPQKIKIEATVMAKLTSSKIKALKEKLGTDILLFFKPQTPATVFRDGTYPELNVIEHHGGDLSLKTDLKNKPLELTSIFEEFTIKAKTDENGVVVFKNLKKGDYIVNIKGFKLIKIKPSRE